MPSITLLHYRNLCEYRIPCEYFTIFLLYQLSLSDFAYLPSSVSTGQRPLAKGLSSAPTTKSVQQTPPQQSPFNKQSNGKALFHECFWSSRCIFHAKFACVYIPFWFSIYYTKSTINCLFEGINELKLTSCHL